MLTVPPWLLNLLPVILLVALIPLLMHGANLLYGWGCGWEFVRERFPAREPQKSGDIYKGQSGGIIRNSTRYSLRRLRIGVAPAGLYVYPSFARHKPCLIPWSSIGSVGVRGASMSVTVEGEQSFYFSLPAKALPVLKAHLTPDKVQQLPPLSGVLTGLAGAAMQDASTPRWVGWLTALVLKLVAKDARDFERKHR